VNVLKSALIHKNEKKRDKNSPKAMGFYRDFRRNLIQFNLTAKNLLQYKLNTMLKDNYSTLIKSISDEIENEISNIDDNLYYLD
jgi:hypothetical protein